MTGIEGPAGQGQDGTVRRQASAGQAAAVPGSFDAGWHDEREATGRPFWAVPVILSFWAIAVPLAVSLWYDDDVEAAASAKPPGAVSCAGLVLELETALRSADAHAAARIGHDLGRAGCPQSDLPTPKGH